MSIPSMWGILICSGAAVIRTGFGWLLLIGLARAADDGRDVVDEGRAFGGDYYDAN